ncbi:hypothetical protein [Paenibacillus wulumuqiensis]|uniref:hypothetical protein n=1 Tax=Paenibacillus wulumuqiensis TaxID=1567107 RepID=UPI000619F1FA|nr:hypothetical protein [Paenibacillus wulumuqiensis]
MDYVEMTLLVVFIVGILIMAFQRIRPIYYFVFFLAISAGLFIYRLFTYDNVWSAFSDSFGMVSLILGIAGIAFWVQHRRTTRHKG